jgi:hypothetical protein
VIVEGPGRRLTLQVFGADYDHFHAVRGYLKLGRGAGLGVFIAPHVGGRDADPGHPVVMVLESGGSARLFEGDLVRWPKREVPVAEAVQRYRGAVASVAGNESRVLRGTWKAHGHVDPDTKRIVVHLTRNLASYGELGIELDTEQDLVRYSFTTKAGKWFTQGGRSESGEAPGLAAAIDAGIALATNLVAQACSFRDTRVRQEYDPTYASTRPRRERAAPKARAEERIGRTAARTRTDARAPASTRGSKRAAKSAAETGPKPIEVIPGDNGMEARIFKGVGGTFNVSLVDTDSGNVVGHKVKIASLEDARGAARTLAPPTRRAPPSAPTGSRTASPIPPSMLPFRQQGSEWEWGSPRGRVRIVPTGDRFMVHRPDGSTLGIADTRTDARSLAMTWFQGVRPPVGFPYGFEPDYFGPEHHRAVARFILPSGAAWAVVAGDLDPVRGVPKNPSTFRVCKVDPEAPDDAHRWPGVAGYTRIRGEEVVPQLLHAAMHAGTEVVDGRWAIYAVRIVAGPLRGRWVALPTERKHFQKPSQQTCVLLWSYGSETTPQGLAHNSPGKLYEAFVEKMADRDVQEIGWGWVQPTDMRGAARLYPVGEALEAYSAGQFDADLGIDGGGLSGPELEELRHRACSCYHGQAHPVAEPHNPDFPDGLMTEAGARQVVPDLAIPDKLTIDPELARQKQHPVAYEILATDTTTGRRMLVGYAPERTRAAFRARMKKPFGAAGGRPVGELLTYLVGTDVEEVVDARDETLIAKAVPLELRWGRTFAEAAVQGEYPFLEDVVARRAKRAAGRATPDPRSPASARREHPPAQPPPERKAKGRKTPAKSTRKAPEAPAPAPSTTPKGKGGRPATDKDQAITQAVASSVAGALERLLAS